MPKGQPLYVYPATGSISNAALYGADSSIVLHCNQEKDMSTSQQRLEARRARLERQLERAEAELERLENLPDEPEVDAVIAFERTYEGNGQSYNFVAYRAHDDWWYLTQDPFRNHAGGHSRMKWLDLLDFIGDNVIYVVTVWEQL